MLVLQAIAGSVLRNVLHLNAHVRHSQPAAKAASVRMRGLRNGHRGDSHLATLIEGWYIDHLSWHWIFWTAAVFTPVMMLCVYLWNSTN